MSVYTPKDFDTDINVTKIHPLKEFSGLIVSILILIVLLYGITALALEWAVRSIPVETENWIWSKLAVSETVDEKLDPETMRRRAYAQQLLDRLPAGRRPTGYHFRISVKETDEINAFAMPGGHIILTSGLLDRLASENELTFVLGHELGHYAHRDHLRGVGMGFAALLVGVAMMGENDAIGDAISGLSTMAQMAYSRHDEAQADLWALDTVHAMYGHAAGASAFFHTLDDTQSRFTMPSILQTHPLGRERIEAMEKTIRERGYSTGKPRPLPWPPAAH